MTENAPSTRENKGELDALRLLVATQFQAIRDLVDERDLRYSQRFDSQEKAVTAALLATERAIQKADLANDKRFDSVNEFRGALSDQTAKLLARTEYVTAHDALIDRVTRVENQIVAGTSQRIGSASAWSVLLATLGGLGVVAAVVFSLIHLAIGH